MRNASSQILIPVLLLAAMLTAGCRTSHSLQTHTEARNETAVADTMSRHLASERAARVYEVIEIEEAGRESTPTGCGETFVAADPGRCPGLIEGSPSGNSFPKRIRITRLTDYREQATETTEAKHTQQDAVLTRVETAQGTAPTSRFTRLQRWLLALLFIGASIWIIAYKNVKR